MRPTARRVSILALALLAALVALFLASSLLPWRPHPQAPTVERVPGEAALVVVAHHDDENGIAVRMLRLLDASQQVHVAWLTDGTFRAAPGVRQRESRCAMSILGIPDSRLHFIGQELELREWKSILRLLPETVERLADLIRSIRPREIYVVAYEGGNIEHDGAHIATIIAAARTGLDLELFEFPLYNAGGASWPHYQVARFATDDRPIFADIPSWPELRTLFDAARCYDSQGAHVWGAALAANLRAISRGSVFRPIPARDHPVRPHPGRLNYEGLSWYVRLVRIVPALEGVFGAPVHGSFDEVAGAYERSLSESN